MLAVRVEAERAALCRFGSRRKAVKHDAGCAGSES